jgi:hypothetical protein
MTNQKKRKNKIINLVLITFLSFFILPTNASEIECKKFDIKCKTNKFINETKDFQKKGLNDSKKQLGKTKDKIIDILPKKK